MDKTIKQAEQDLALAGYAETTQQQYLATTRHLSGRFGRPLDALSREDLRTYVAELTARGLSASWLNTQLAALMFVYRKTLGRPEVVSFITFPKQHSPLPVVLSLDEVAAVLRGIKVQLYLAIAMVIYGTGVRLSEALALKVTDIDGARGVLQVRHGKGDKAREVKLSPTLYQWLREYWRRERPPLPYLFATKRTGRPPAKDTVRKALADAGKQGWVRKPVRPHVLRHSFATHLLEEGTDVRVVGALLGHESLSSTMRYARVTEKLVREAPSPIDLLPKRRY
jgi:site-specific recombinase XerD